MKNEKICWRYHDFTHVYQKSQSHDVRFLRYRVRQAEFFDVLGHFLTFQPPENPKNQNFKIEKKPWRYYNFTHFHHKWQSYDIWFAMDRICCHSGPFFALLYPLWTQKIKILEKWKKIPEDIIILQMCAINESYIMYGSWYIKCNKQNFLSLWTFFCPFTLVTTQKIKFHKMKKTRGDIIILHCNY